MINIRTAVEADIPLILGLIRELADFEKLGHEVTADEETLRRNLFTERRAAEVLLAEREGEVAGIAIFFLNFSTFLGKPGLYLEDLYVKSDQRGAGVGMALLSRLAQIAIERDCGRMEWWVLDWNRKAIDLYMKLGARPMDEWTVFRLKGSELRNLAHGEDAGEGGE